jgi:hypothetical protein
MAKPWTTTGLNETIRAFQPACIIAAAADLDVFTALSRQSMMAATLAAAIGADPRATTILLDSLVALELLDKRQDVYSVPPDVTERLSADSPINVLAAVRHQGNCLRRWAQLAQVVRDGTPAERVPSIRGAVADCEAFIGAMNSFTAGVAPDIVGKLASRQFQRLLDVGGASGTWTIAFLRAAPDATAVLFDRPDVIPMARTRLKSAGLLDRVTLVPGDYDVDVLPAGADFAWLSAVTHQNSRAQNQALFARIHAALTAGGTLVIRDIVMDPSRTGPPAGALFAVNMLVATEGGNSYTFNESREDLTAAGFADIELLHEDEWMNSLISARKA